MIFSGQMASGTLYSTNPWFATDVAVRYRKGNHFAWVCEYFDSRVAPPGSAAAMIAPSSNPCVIYRNLLEDTKNQDDYSLLIRGYKRTFYPIPHMTKQGGGLPLATRVRILVGRAILWFTEAAMNERIARMRGEEYRPPYAPHGMLEWRQWSR